MHKPHQQEKDNTTKPNSPRNEAGGTLLTHFEYISSPTSRNRSCFSLMSAVDVYTIEPTSSSLPSASMKRLAPSSLPTREIKKIAVALP